MVETIRIEIPIKVNDKTKPALSLITKNLDKVCDSTENSQRALTNMEKKVTQFDKVYDKMQKRLSAFTKEKYLLVLNTLDMASPIIDRLESRLYSLTSRDWNVTMKASMVDIDIGTANIDGKSLGKAFAAGFMEEFNIDILNDKSESKKTAWGLIESMGSVVGTFNDFYDFGGNIKEMNKGGSKSADSSSSLKSNVVGMASMLGGMAAVGTLIDGGVDLYESFKTEDDKKRTAYGGSGLAKVAGVAMGGVAGGAIAGTKAGAAIGSAFGGVGAIPGAVIGAGIGGAVGWFSGEQIKKSYEADLKKAQEAARKLRLEEEQAKYESVELKKALADADMTAEEFGQKFQKAVDENLVKHFGKIRLSMDEIKSTAKQVVFDNAYESMKKFNDATESAEQSLVSLQNASAEVDKLNWKASLGKKMNEEEKIVYKQGIEDMLESAKVYAEDQHYEVSTAYDVIFGGDTNSEIENSVNSYYASIQKQLDSDEIEIMKKVNFFIEDGVITPNEQKKLYGLIEKVRGGGKSDSDIESQTEMGLKILEAKYGGGTSDAASYTGMQVEMKALSSNAEDTYNEALEVVLIDLERRYENKSKDELYYEELEDITANYKEQISTLHERLKNFQMDFIMDGYGEDIEAVAPGTREESSKRIESGISSALSNGVDIQTWNTDEGVASAVDYLGLDGIAKETQRNIIMYVTGMVATFPDQFKTPVKVTADKGIASDMLELKGDNPIKEVDRYANTLQEQNAANFPPSHNINIVPANDTNYILNPPNPTILLFDGLKEIFGLKENKDKPLGNAHSSGTFIANGPSDNQYISGVPVADVTNILPSIDNTALIDREAIRNETAKDLDHAFSEDFNEKIKVVVEADYFLKNPFVDLKFLSGATAALYSNPSSSKESGNKIKNKDPIPKGTAVQTEYARGGILSVPHIGLVAEDGPEAIIPLGGKRRSRGISLWERAGEILGIRKYAEGGISDNERYSHNPLMGNEDLKYINSNNSNLTRENSDSLDAISQDSSVTIPVSTDTSGKSSDIKIEVQMNPQFEINGSNSEEDIMQVIKRNLKELADDVSGEIAMKLEKVFSNMPLKGV